jgi:hypothetical protein
MFECQGGILCVRQLFALIAVSAVAGSLLEAQVRNVRVSAPDAVGPNEVSIAINPRNPLQLAAGSNLRYFYRSSDGGATWTQGQLPRGTWGDPCVAFDAEGTLLYAHLSNLPSPAYFIDRLIVHRSTDGGATWLDSAEVGYRPPRAQQDKEWLATDMASSPFRGAVYMTWTEFDAYGSSVPGDSSRILFSRSTDRGATWSAPVRISDRAGDCLDDDNTVEGAVPAVGPGGQIYVSWSGPLGIMLDRSTDGGVTWGADVPVSDHPGGWAFDVPGIFRCNGLPVTVCDTGSSPYRGRIYVLWGDQRNGLEDSDVWIASSADRGMTWSAPKRVNDDLTGRHQFFPWIAIDQSTGNLWVVFYDRRETVGNATDVYLARSTDGGTTFTNMRVSESSFVPDPTVFFGDYTNIAAREGSVYPIWMRMDGTTMSIWTAIFVDTTVADVAGPASAPGEYRLFQNYPNPFNGETLISFQTAGPGRVRLSVFDVLGREVRVLVDEVRMQGAYTERFDALGLPTGQYFYRLRAGEEFVQQRRMTYLK